MARGIADSYCSISGLPCRHHSNDQTLLIKACSDLFTKRPKFLKIWTEPTEWCNNASKSVADLKGFCPAKMALSYRDYGMMNAKEKLQDRRGKPAPRKRLRKQAR